MKYKLTFFIVGAVLFLGLANGISYMQSAKEQPVEVIVRPSKETYSLGEVVYLDFLIKNKSSETIKIGGAITIEDGTLSVSISKDGKTFEEYKHTKWGKADVKRNPIELKPNEITTTSASVLWNNKPKISDRIAADVQEQASRGKIKTDFAFPDTGDYFIKVSYFIYLTAKPIFVESEPIKITITEPIGEDLKVWNIIQDNGDFAYFIQEGDFRIPSYKPEQRVRLQQKVEQLINQYPNSFYAELLQQSLSKFRASEEERKTFLEKRKQSN